MANKSLGIEPKKLKYVYIGFASGFISSVTLQPFDLLKTRVQQSSDSTLRGSFNDILNISRTGTSYDYLALMKQLWRGTIPSVVRTSVGSGLFFSILHMTRVYIQNYSEKYQKSDSTNGLMGIKRSSILPQIGGYANLIAGASVRGFVGFLMMPISVLKVRFESSKYSNSSILSTARSIYNQHGVRGFFYGFTATLIRDAPYAGLYLLFYEQAKSIIPGLLPVSLINSKDPESKVMPSSAAAMVNGSCAAISAALAVTITNPFDTIKTRIQLFPNDYSGSMWSAFRKISRGSGFMSLFDGLSLRIFRKALASGISWMVFEELARRI
ncbi:solute carrier family 25 member 38 [Dipodascopsis uninucleata]